MRFAILGPLEVERDGRPVNLGAPKQRAVLARLLLDSPRPVSVDRLVEDLWSGDPPGHATTSLQAYVSNLRRALEPDRAPRTPATVLVTRPPGYLLRLPDGDDLDATRFRTLAARAADAHEGGHHGAAHRAAVDALALWRGPALLDVREEPWAAAAATELEDLRLAVDETRLSAALELGHAAEVAAEVEALTATDPLRERLWELLALALYRAGRPAAALARLRKVRLLLRDELGLGPGPRLQRLERAILQHDDAVLGPAPQRSVDPGTEAGDGRPRADTTGLGTAGLDTAGRPPLVGRDALLDRLWVTVSAARAGGPRWLLLTGDAGMGKTRLAEALRERARDDGWLLAGARCHDDPDTPSHWVWAQVLRDLGGSGAGADPLHALATAARAESGGDAARFALYDGVRRALVHAADARPVLVVVDDLQWADGDSLRALRFLAVQLADRPVVVLATVRDGESTDLLDDVLGTVERRPGAERVALPPVDVAAVRGIAEALTGACVDDAVARDLHARSGGNPLFAAELARLATTTGPARALPHGVLDVVGRRLARLPDQVQQALAVAAVVGEEVDVAVLAATEGIDVATELERLDPALATGVLTEVSTALRVRFAHALLRESLLARLSPLERRRTHARIAAALRRRATAGASAELAHHLVEAGPLGDLTAARDAATAIARQAVERLAFDEAARWFDRALDVARQQEAVGPPDPRGRYALLLARGDALYRSGQVMAARHVLVDAVGAAMELDDLDAVAGAAAALGATGGVWTWVDMGEVPPQVIGTLGSVLARLGDADSAARARLLSTIATGLYYGDDPATVDALSAEAVDLARRLDDSHLLADTLLDRAFALRLPERSRDVVRHADEALGLPGLTDLQVVVGHGRRFYGLLHEGDLPAAVAAHRQSLDAARAAHLLVPQMQLAHFPAALAVAEGRLDDAERLIAGIRDRADLVHLPMLAIGLLGVEALVLKHRGRLAERLEEAERVTGVIPMRAAHQLVALARLAAGDPAGARAAWQTSHSTPGIAWLEVLADVVEVELREGLLPRPVAPTSQDTALLRLLLAREPMIAAAGSSYPWLPVGLALGAHEHRLGLLDDAERHLRRVIARSEAWGTHTWTALTRWRLAAVLEERGGDDAAEAGPVRAQARAAADALGIVLPSVSGAGLVVP